MLQQHNINVIQLKGRLEAFSAARLKEQYQPLLNRGEKFIVIDLSQVDFLDSTGMATLISLLKSLMAVGGDVVLVKPDNPNAFRILTLARFDKVFKIADTLDDAVALI